MAEADEECRLFKIAYGSYEWSNNFRVVQFGACVGLLMPHFCAIPEKDRSNLLKDVEKTLTNCFLQKQLRYDDIKWHHIMRFRDGGSAHIIVVDMGQCVEGDSDGKWIQEHIGILRKRLPVTSSPRKLDFSPDSSES